MSDKFILLFDMDGVTCQWYDGLLATYRQRYPNRPFVEPKDVTKFYVEEMYPAEHQADVIAIARERGFYSRLEPVPGAIEALKDIEANCLDFIDPFICSSPEVEYEGMLCHSEKADWVERHLGSFWTKRLVLTKDKTLVRGHILIDDKPSVTGAMNPTWDHLLFEQPYNRHVQDKSTFRWSDWPALKAALKPAIEEKSLILLAS